MEQRPIWPLTGQQFSAGWQCNYCLHQASYLGAQGKFHTLATHKRALYKGQKHID